MRLPNESTDGLLRRLARARLPKTKTKPTLDWSGLSFLEFTERLGVPLSTPQRVMAAVAFDRVEPCELEGEDYEVAQRLLTEPGAPPVDRIPESARSVLTLVKGARVGGTYLSALYCSWRSLVADLSTLAPGERARAILGAPELDLASQALTYAVGVFESHQDLAACIVRQSASSLLIERPHDGREVDITVRAAKRGGRSFRARSLVAAVLSEVAFFEDNSHVVNDEDCFRAVKPRVLPGGMTLLESTPWTEAGLLYDEFERNFGAPDTSIAMRAPTRFFLPTKRNLEVVAQEEATDEDNAAREFGAEFLAAGTALFFDPKTLKAALQPVEPRTEPGPHTAAYMGGDVGLVRDASAFVSVHREPLSAVRSPTDQQLEALAGYLTARGGEQVQHKPPPARYLVAELEEQKPTRGKPLKLSEVVAAGAAMAARHKCSDIVVDQYNLEAAREHCPAGLVLWAPTSTQQDVGARFSMARMLFGEGQVVIPEQLKALVQQLQEVRKRPLPGGRVAIILKRKPGSHGDLVSAFVLALWRAHEAGATLGELPSPEGQERRGRETGGF